MLKKRVFVFAATLIMTVSSVSCGKTEQKAGSEFETTTAAPDTTASGGSASEKSDKKGIDLSFGMLGYVKKSKKSSANANASSLYKAIYSSITDMEKKFADNVIYSHTDGGDELDKYVRENYFTSDDDIEYILSTDNSGYPLWIICSRNTKNDDYVGFYGNSSRADELREMNWANVLKIFGYEQGEYTDIRLENENFESTSEPQIQSIGFGDGRSVNYTELDDLDLMALSIGMEYNFGTVQKPLYMYGVFGKDEPFTADVPWEMPEHGDIEFIIEMEGVQIGRVMCWETGTDKSLVGSFNLRGERYYLSDSSWDEILEYFGYTRGEYVEFQN